MTDDRRLSEMHPYCIYVFDSNTANEAAMAVKEGTYETIIHYHSTKHSQTKQSLHQTMIPQSMQQPIPQPHMQPHPQQHVSPHMMGGPPPSYPAVPPQMAQQQQPYDPNLSPQKMKERESKLNRLGQLAQLTTQPPPPNLAQVPPPPPTMHQMTNSNQTQQRSAQPHQLPPQSQAPQQQQQPPPSQQQQQVQQPPPQQTQQQQHLDPLSSMAAMSECPNMDSYGHTIHHHPPS